MTPSINSIDFSFLCPCCKLLYAEHAIRHVDADMIYPFGLLSQSLPMSGLPVQQVLIVHQMPYTSRLEEEHVMCCVSMLNQLQ